MRIPHGQLQYDADGRWYYMDVPFTGVSIGTLSGRIIEATFKDGIQEGKQTIYDEDGAIAEEVLMSDGAYEGERKIYQKGILTKVITYKDAIKISEVDIAKDGTRPSQL